jgi:hypothetical protein
MAKKKVINKELLLRTLAHIEANPERWDQNQWICGTSYCFGGWAVKLDGGRFSRKHPYSVLAREDDFPEDIQIYSSSAHYVYISHRARRILGLTKKQAESLFLWNNTLEKLKAKVNRLVGIS